MFGLKFWAFVVGAAPLDGALEAFWSELGFVVVQGYGLTETAPIVTLNHPFGTTKGSVGKVIAGVDVRIAEDGEILVKGENVTRGYFNAAAETAQAFEDGWFHTGDVGEISPGGELFIRGRKKEMIVTPEGLNVFPEDVERVLNRISGVRDSAVVGCGRLAERSGCMRSLVLEPGTDLDAVVREANHELADHQKIRQALVWPDAELPRTEGTRKLKRTAIAEWVGSGHAPPRAAAVGRSHVGARWRSTPAAADLSSSTTLEELGLSSLERVELMVALEDAFETRIDEGAFSGARDIGQLRTLVEQAPKSDAPSGDPVDFPRWNRSWPARTLRRASLPTWILPLARVFAWLRVEGLRSVRFDARPGHLRRQPPEPHGRAGDPGGIAAAMALSRGARDGEGILQAALFSRAVQPAGLVHQQPELLARRRCSSTRSRCRNAKRARGRRFATSARCWRMISRC